MNEDFKQEEDTEKKVSPWRVWDIIIILPILAGVIFFCIYPFYQAVVVIAFLVLGVLAFAKPLYRRDIPRTITFKMVTAILRGVGYSLALIVMILPWTMNSDRKWYYPVQKMLYGTDKQTEDFLPDKIPKNAENYKAIFCRSVFPGATRIELSFFTDSNTINEYRQKAIIGGATSESPEFGGASRCRLEMETIGISYENAEIYYYPNSSEHFPKFYILDEASGYVKIYY